MWDFLALTHLFTIVIDICLISGIYGSEPTSGFTPLANTTAVVVMYTVTGIFCVVAWCICIVFDYQYAERYLVHILLLLEIRAILNSIVKDAQENNAANNPEHTGVYAYFCDSRRHICNLRVV